MPCQSTYAWEGLTLTRRTVLTGADLAPEWALARVRNALEEHRGEAQGKPSDGQFDFDDRVVCISMTGAFLPSVVVGHVKAESVPGGGLAVIATASLKQLVIGVALSTVGITAFFAYHGIVFTEFYWIWVSLMLLAAGWHLHEIDRVLTMVTTAGTSL